MNSLARLKSHESSLVLPPGLLPALAQRAKACFITSLEPQVPYDASYLYVCVCVTTNTVMIMMLW